MTDKDKSTRIPLIIDQETLDFPYENETLNWQSLKLKNTREHLFVNCTFPSLLIIEIERPVAFTFIGCTFKKLLISDVHSGVECVFGFCSFPPNMLAHIDDPIFIRCRCSNLHYQICLESEKVVEVSLSPREEEKKDEEEESEEILDITKEKRSESFELLPEADPELVALGGGESPEILDITEEKRSESFELIPEADPELVAPGGDSPNIVVFEDKPAEVIKISENEKVSRPIMNFFIRDSYL